MRSTRTARNAWHGRVINEPTRSAQVGLAWLLHHSPRTLLIAGTADTGHLEENLAAGAITLDEQTLAALDAVPTRPFTLPGH